MKHNNKIISRIIDYAKKMFKLFRFNSDYGEFSYHFDIYFHELKDNLFLLTRSFKF